MTTTELAQLTARAERVERIIVALQAFEDCETDHQHCRAEEGLREALGGETKENTGRRLTKQDTDS